MQYTNDITIQIGDAIMSLSQKCPNLGVIFDKTLNMKAHISNMCRAAYMQLRNIGAIRKYLSADSCSQLIHAFITSRLDYCNSLLINLPKSSLKSLQRVQNTAARILTLSRKHDHVTPVLIEIHWLPVQLRSIFKCLLLVYKCLMTGQPAYLSDLLTRYTTTRTLRSSDKLLLQPTRYRLESYGKRAFSVAAPILWNDLPLCVRQSENITSFKSCLKTHLFTLFVNDPHVFMF